MLCKVFSALMVITFDYKYSRKEDDNNSLSAIVAEVSKTKFNLNGVEGAAG